MSDEPAFVDTNVLIYAFDTKSPAKQAVARECLRALGAKGTLSVQVLGEFYHVVVIRQRTLTTAEVESIFDRLPMRVELIDAEVVRSAMRLQNRFGLGYWDSLILAAARRAGCRVVLSEDLNPGQDYDGVVVRNPFAETAAKVQHPPR